MDLPGPIHDILLVFLGSGLILGGLGVVLFPISSAFDLGLVLVCISLFYIPSNSYFVAAAQLLIYVGAVNVNIVFAVMFMNGSEIFIFGPLEMGSLPWLASRCDFCTNYHYPRDVMVRDHLDDKIKPDVRTGPNK